jgi:hypothetical protein
MEMQSRKLGLIWIAPALLGADAAMAADPWADRVVEYRPGATTNPYDDPSAALGSPERFTGEGSFPSVVSMFSPPFLANEIVSIGEGGYLTVAFDEPIRNLATNQFGIDFIIFGNGGFIDRDYPRGTIGSPPSTFGLDLMRVSVSEDGEHFISLGDFTEGLFPTQGFADVGPYSDVPGRVPTDFTRPMDPRLTLASFAGLTFDEALVLYDGSGGGTPIDVDPTGLASIWFVRIDVLDDLNPLTKLTVEIDGFATVPEPSSILMLCLFGAAFRRRR